jgi:hypothetical protein
MEAAMRSGHGVKGEQGRRGKRPARGAGGLAQAAPEAQAPLGPAPSYDEVLDLAVEYSFPCSDPIAVESCCGGIATRSQAPEVPPDRGRP